MTITNRLFLYSLLLLLFTPSSLFAAPAWVVQIATGTGWNARTNLKIEQDGEKNIDMSAEYETKAWETTAPYYDLRIARWEEDKAWEFESLHHKLYLKNKPPEVQHFAISHGYNMNTINRAWLVKDFIYRAGAGFVMTHPETEVRGKKNEDDGGLRGFYISGLTAQAAIEKRIPYSEKIFFSLEAKATASYARIPIGDGAATVPNAAIHALFGVGYIF